MTYDRPPNKNSLSVLWYRGSDQGDITPPLLYMDRAMEHIYICVKHTYTSVKINIYIFVATPTPNGSCLYLKVRYNLSYTLVVGWVEGWVGKKVLFCVAHGVLTVYAPKITLVADRLLYIEFGPQLICVPHDHIYQNVSYVVFLTHNCREKGRTTIV